MSANPLGIAFRETMTGPFALGETNPQSGEAAGRKTGTSLALHAAIEIPDLDDFIADATHTGTITGHVDFAPWRDHIPAERGVFRLFSPTGTKGLTRMVYELGFEHHGQAYYLAGHKDVRNDRSGTDLWYDTTTLFARLHEGTASSAPVIGAGVLRLGLPDLIHLTSSLRVINAHNPAEHMRALAMFGRFFMGSLWETYGPGAP